MPEITTDYIRIPVVKKEKGDRIRTITISSRRGIKALYSTNRKLVLTYLFLKSKKWTKQSAKEWIKTHSSKEKSLITKSINMSQRFQFEIPVLKTRVKVELDKNGNQVERRFIEGIASSTDVDLMGDQMAPEAIQTMADSIKHHVIALNAEHDKSWQSELGEVSELTVDDDYNLKMVAELDKTSKAADLWYALVEKGKKLGLSIGGFVKDYRMESADDGLGWKKVFTDIELDHVAVTSTPANPKTWVSAIAKSISSSDYDKKAEALREAMAVNKEFNHHNDGALYDDDNGSVDSDKLREVLLSLVSEENVSKKVLLHLNKHVKAISISKLFEGIEETAGKDMDLESIKSTQLLKLINQYSEMAKNKPLETDDVEKMSEEVVEPQVEEKEASEEEVTESVNLENGDNEEAKSDEPSEEESKEEAPIEEKEEEKSEEEPVEEETVETKSEDESEEESKDEPKEEVKEEEKTEEAPAEEVKEEEEIKEASIDENRLTAIEEGIENLTKSLKSEEITKTLSTLNKSLEEVQNGIELLNKRIDAIENQPAERKFIEVDKFLGNDSGSTKPELSLQEALKKAEEENKYSSQLFAEKQRIRKEYADKYGIL